MTDTAQNDEQPSYTPGTSLFYTSPEDSNPAAVPSYVALTAGAGTFKLDLWVDDQPNEAHRICATTDKVDIGVGGNATFDGTGTFENDGGTEVRPITASAMINPADGTITLAWRAPTELRDETRRVEFRPEQDAADALSADMYEQLASFGLEAPTPGPTDA